MINLIFNTATQSSTVDGIIAVILLIGAYLIGSIPFGIVIGKGIKKIDIREHGSKNIGTTNAIRVLGKKLGLLVFALDVLKGVVVILLVKILGIYGVYNSPIDDIFYGVAAIIGHGFPLFLNFKGGKVVATSLGVIFVISPTAALVCLVVFYITLKASGYVSLASTFATLAVFTVTLILFFVGVEPTNFGEYFIVKTSLTKMILISLTALLIFVKHRKNYVRLIKGTENSFKKKKETKTVETNNQ